MKLFVWLIAVQWSLVASEESFLPFASAEMDKAALRIMEANFPHTRKARSSPDQVQFGKNAKELQRLVLDKIVGVQKLAMHNPTDVHIFPATGKQTSNRYNDYSKVRLATTENYIGQPNCSSSVKIYSFQQDSFRQEAKLVEYAPYRLEYFSIVHSDGRLDRFLAVGGFDHTLRTPSRLTRLAVYKQSHEWTIAFQLPMSVTALRFVSTHNSDMLVVAQHVSEYTDMITFLRYDLFKEEFILHDRFPVPRVSDIEIVKKGEDFYLLIAVYHDHMGNLQTNSLIYKYASTELKFRPYSSFHTIGVKDLNVFTYNDVIYVIAAYEASGHKDRKRFDAPSVIYRVHEPFVLKPVTTIATSAARQTTTVVIPACASKVLIIAIDNSDNFDQMSLHLFDAQTEKVSNQPVSFYQSSSHNGKPNPAKFATYFVNNRLFVLLATANKNVENLLEIKYEIENIGNPLQKLIKSTQIELEKIESSIKSMQNLVVNGHRILEEAVVTNSDLLVKGTKYFNGKISAQNLQVFSIVIENGSIFHQQNSTRSKAKLDEFEKGIEVEYLESQLNEHEGRINGSRERMSDYLLLNAAHKVHGAYRFDNITLAQNAAFGTLNASKINGVDVDFLIGDVVQQNTNDVIHGKKVFDVGTMLGSVEVEGKVNKVKISRDMVTIHGSQLIQSSKIESDDLGFNASLYLAGLLNSVNVTSEFLGLRENVKVGGAKYFRSNFNADSMSINGLLDGIAVNLFADDVMVKDSPNKVVGVKSFKASPAVHGDVLVEGNVNRVDLKTLGKEVLRLGKPGFSQEQISLVFISPVDIIGNLSVDGKINELTLPRDLVLVNASQSINGTKTFSDGCSVIKDVTVTGRLDGLETNDILLVSSSQTVTGVKRFEKDSVLLGNLNLGEGNTIGGINLANLRDNIVSLKGDQNLTGSYQLNKVNYDGPSFLFDGKVHEKPMSYYQELFSKAVSPDSDQSITAAKALSSQTTITGNLSVSKKLNQFSLPSDYLHRSSDQIVLTSFRLDGALEATNGIKVAGMNVAEAANPIVTVENDGVILGEKVFYDDLTVAENLQYVDKDTKSDIFKALLHKDGEQRVSGSRKMFRNVAVSGGIDAWEDVSVKTTVDGVDLFALSKKTVVDSETEIVFRNSVFNGTVKLGSMSLKTINNISLDEVFKDIVTLDGEQTIHQLKSFRQMAIKRDLVTNATVDGVVVAQLSKSVATVEDGFTVDGEASFENVSVNNIEVSGRIHEKSLLEMYGNTVLRSKDANVVTNITVLGDLKTHHDISCTSLNGFRPAVDFVSKQKSQIIKGLKTFSDDVTVVGNVFTEGLVNKLDLEVLDKEVVTKNKAQVINGVKTINLARSNGDVLVSRNTDGVSLKLLEKSVVYTNRDSFISGPLVFDGSCFMRKSVSVSGLVNQLDLNASFIDAVTLLETETIQGQKRFSSNVTVLEKVHVEQNINLKGLVNSVNLSLLHQDVLMTDGNQVMNGMNDFVQPVRFENGLHTAGMINGVDLGTDVVFTHGNQEISGKKKFYGDLKTAGNIEVSGYTAGHDLSLLQKDTILQGEAQYVTGRKTLRKATVLSQNLLSNGTVDGFDFSVNEPLKLAANQILTEAVTFTSDLRGLGDIHANNSELGKRLLDIEKRRVHLHQYQKMQGNFQVHGNVQVQGDLTVQGEISPGNLSRLQNFVNAFGKAVKQSKVRQNDSCKTLEYVRNVFNSAPFQVDYFEDHQVFDKLQAREIFPFESGNDRYLAVAAMQEGRNCAVTQMFKLDDKSKKFMAFQTLHVEGSQNYAFFTNAGEEYLAIGADASYCGFRGTSVLYKLDRAAKAFVKQQILTHYDVKNIFAFNDGQGIRLVITSGRPTGPYIQIFHLLLGTFKPLVSHHVPGFHLVSAKRYNISGIRLLAAVLRPRDAFMLDTVKIFRVESYSLHNHSRIDEFSIHGVALFNHRSSIIAVVSSHKEIGIPNGGPGYVLLFVSNRTKRFYPMISFPVDFPTDVEIFYIKDQQFLLVPHLHAGFTLFRFRESAVPEKLGSFPQVGLERISHFDINGTSHVALAAYWPAKLNKHRVQKTPSSKLLRLVTSGIEQRDIQSKTNC